MVSRLRGGIWATARVKSANREALAACLPAVPSLPRGQLAAADMTHGVLLSKSSQPACQFTPSPYGTRTHRETPSAARSSWSFSLQASSCLAVAPG